MNFTDEMWGKIIQTQIVAIIQQVAQKTIIPKLSTSDINYSKKTQYLITQSITLARNTDMQRFREQVIKNQTNLNKKKLISIGSYLTVSFKVYL